MAATPITAETLVKLTERERVYDYGNGTTVVLKEVVELIVRASGTHRVKTHDGKLHIVSKGWLAIHIDDGDKDWTA